MSNLSAIIDKKGVKRTWLEKETGILVQNIYQYETGKRKITNNIAKRLAKPLEVNYMEIIEDEGIAVSD